MKICLYSPYIPEHFGGGEKYLLDVAVSLSQRHQVVVAVPAQYAGDASIVDKYEKFLDRSLAAVSFVPTPLGTRASFFKKLCWTKQFDVVYYLTDGSLFFSLAKKNILHIQFPLKLDKSSWLEKLKLSNWQIKNTNSEFTKNIIEPSWPIKIDLVHHPLIEVEKIQQQTSQISKEKIILHVGRFFKQLHSKRQDVMIDLFRELVKNNPESSKGWKLVFIGGVEDQEYLSSVKRKKRNLPIEFYHDLSREELIKWYGRASIYWHTTGFGVNPIKHPEKVEHFGISTCEAMAAGCVPVVHAKGGQLEVMGESLKECLWLTKKECLEKTAELMQNHTKWLQLSQLAQLQSQRFNKSVFEEKLSSMIEV